MSHQRFQFRLEFVLRRYRIQQIPYHADSVVYPFGIGLGDIYPRIRRMRRIRGVDSQFPIPCPGMMTAQIAQVAEHKNPRGQDGSLQAEMLGDTLLHALAPEVGVYVAEISERQNLGKKRDK